MLIRQFRLTHNSLKIHISPNGHLFSSFRWQRMSTASFPTTTTLCVGVRSVWRAKARCLHTFWRDAGKGAGHLRASSHSTPTVSVGRAPLPTAVFAPSLVPHKQWPATRTSGPRAQACRKWPPPPALPGICHQLLQQWCNACYPKESLGIKKRVEMGKRIAVAEKSLPLLLIIVFLVVEYRKEQKLILQREAQDASLLSLWDHPTPWSDSPSPFEQFASVRIWDAFATWCFVINPRPRSLWDPISFSKTDSVACNHLTTTNT